MSKNSKGFTSDVITALYVRFGAWLLVRAGAHKAALSINIHYQFFRVLDTNWHAVPSYEQLLQHFGARGLRKAENPMRFLTETDTVVVSAKLRERDTEQRRIAAILAEPTDSWSAQLLNQYVDTLYARMNSGDIDLRSIRLAARAAVNLLKVSQLSLGALPTQKTLKAFWGASPGQVAAVTGFVGYLNKQYGLALQVKPNPSWLAKAKRKRAERELTAMLAEEVDDDFEARWIVKGLAYFHDLPRVSRKDLSFQSQEYQGVAGYNVVYKQKSLWVPSASSYERGSLRT